MLLGIDQGTTGTAVVAFDEALKPVARAYRGVESFHPRAGWVEQDPLQLLGTVVEAVAEVCAKVGSIQAVGLANQGESVIAWNRQTGEPLSQVIVWSDRRADQELGALAGSDFGRTIQRKTGLRLSDYFSAPKMAWLLSHSARVREACVSGELALGTVDVWLGARLAGTFMSDDSTASRTLLYGLSEGGWNEALLTEFGIPRQTLAEIRPTVGELGALAHKSWPTPLPWRASLVDQPAALVGNGCLTAGQMKATYGTGCFAVANLGCDLPANLESPLGTSVGWSEPGRRSFIKDGGVYSAGTAIEWLVRLGIAPDAASTAEMAMSAEGPIPWFLPAFTGLGQPWWDGQARGAMGGLTAGVGPKELVRAVLDSIAFRVRDILEALAADGIPLPAALKVDGGLTRNRYLMQRQADLLGTSVEVASDSEATALGAAFLAGRQAGIVDSLPQSAPAAVYEPAISSSQRDTEYSDWLRWLNRSRKSV